MQSHTDEKSDDVPSSVSSAFHTDDISHGTGENDVHDDSGEISPYC